MMNSYHDRTKHSYHSIRQHAGHLDWSQQPSQYKSYPNTYKKISLDEKNPVDLFLYRIAGITAKKTYASGAYFLRTNPSAGALFPNELYFQVRGIEAFRDGIYHMDIKHSSLTLLHPLYKGEGIEKDLDLDQPVKGYIFLVSAVYFRSSWKYKDRAFRYCLLDGGHLLGGIEASSYIEEVAVKHLYGFDKVALNAKFGFKDREFFLSASIVGVPKGEAIDEAIQMKLPYVEGSGTFIVNDTIIQAYHDSLDLLAPKKCHRASNFHFRKDAFEEAIFKRRSIREMHSVALNKGHFEFIMDVVNQSVMSDCEEEVAIYVIVNHVDGMHRGLYHDGKCIQKGDFRKKAGYLCLEQYHLGADSALTFFMISSSKNYQAMYLKAGILGHRLYLTASYLQIGCSGIGAYYDDEVVEFLDLDDTHMVLYGVCIGN